MLTSRVPCAESGELSSIELDNRLESLYRENLKLSEAVDQVIQGESPDMNIIDSINILAALREVSEEASRNAMSLNKSRSTTLKRKAGAGEDGEESSIAPSPRPGPGSRDRLGVEKSQKRGTSVPSTREVSVKIEDGAESVTSSVDGSKREFFKLSFIFALWSRFFFSFQSHDVVVPFLTTIPPATTPRFGPRFCSSFLGQSTHAQRYPCLKLPMCLLPCFQPFFLITITCNKGAFYRYKNAVTSLIPGPPRRPRSHQIPPQAYPAYLIVLSRLSDLS